MRITLFAILLCIGGMDMQAQEFNRWESKFSTLQLDIAYSYVDCHFPEKGIHNSYLLLRITNLTNQEIKIAYDLDRWYNGQKSSPDKNGFTYTLSTGTSISGSCSDLKKGLHLFAKKLDVKAESILTNFNLENIRINGKPLAK